MQSDICGVELTLQQNLNQTIDGIYEDLENVQYYPFDLASLVLGTLLQFACKGQNFLPITLARKKIKEINPNWLKHTLPLVLNDYIALDDDWEYRRLCELIKEVVPDMLPWVLKLSEDSEDINIIEIVNEFREECLG